MVRRFTGTALLALVALVGCTQPGGRSTSVDPGASTPSPELQRIAVIVMENREYDEVIRDPDAPFLNTLAEEYAQTDQMYGITHPSLPNYLGLLSGETHGVTQNCSDCFVDAPNLVDQLEHAGISWKAYMDQMPEPCWTQDDGDYVVRHNPFVYFDSIREDAERCSKVVPLTDLGRDLDVGELPRFIWITPDLCNDSHDCSVEHGDNFLEHVVPILTDAMGENSVVIVTFDEGETDEGCCEGADGGHIATVIAGSRALRGAHLESPTTLYSVLRTVEEAFDLPLLGEAGCKCTISLGSLITPH